MPICRGYGRASKDKQIVSVFQQESVCQDAFGLFTRIKPDWANLTWGGFFVEEENTTRTSKFRERKTGHILLAATQPGDMILVAKYDRIFANVIDACETIELIEQRKFRIHILDAELDISTNMGQAAFKMFSIFKELEVKEIRSRSRDNVAYRKGHGLPFNKQPIGWKYAVVEIRGQRRSFYVPDRESRALAKRILALRTQLGRYDRTLDELNRLRVMRPNGTSRWRYTQVKRWCRAAIHDFPLPDGSQEPAPIPAEANPYRPPTIAPYS